MLTFDDCIVFADVEKKGKRTEEGVRGQDFSNALEYLLTFGTGKKKDG